MKNKLAILKCLVLLCGAVATTAAFGQTTCVWTGAGDGTNYGTAGNWNPALVPAGVSPSGDTAEWDGVTPTNLVISCRTLPIVEFPTFVNFALTANQTNSVQIISPVSASPSLPVFGITNDSPNAAFVLGDGTANLLNIIARPSGAIHHWVNNSAAPVTINPSVRLAAGGGATYTLEFGGTGDWVANNNLENAGGPAQFIQVDGPGAVIWIPTAYSQPNGIGSPITLNGGALILKGNHPDINSQGITNNAAFEFDAPSQTQTLSGVISGSGLLQVNNGTLTLAGANTYSGGTIINGGTLQVGAGGTSGSIGTGNVTNNGTLIFNRTNSLTYDGNISGGGAVTVQSGTVTLTGSNSYTGGTSVSNGATLNIGNGGSGANLGLDSPLVNNGLMTFNNQSEIDIRGFSSTISGTGNFRISGTGLIGFYGVNSYTGWTTIDPGATLGVCIGTEGGFGMAGLPITNNGTLLMLRQDIGVFIITNNIVGSGRLVKDVSIDNIGDCTLYGTNAYTGGTIIAGGGITLGDGVTAGAGAIVGDVIFTNSLPWGPWAYRWLEFNRPDNFTFGGFIGGTNNGFVGARGVVRQNGTGVLTLTNNNNNWIDGTIVSHGVLQIGDGHAYGAIGNGSLNVQSVIVFNRSDAHTFPGNINGTTGVVVQAGSGTLTLSSAINLIDGLGSYGSLAASNGTMVVTSGRVNGSVKVSGGKFISPAAGMVGMVSVSNNLTIGSGTLVVCVDKLLSPSNTVYLVFGNLTANGGTLQLVNYGPAFQVGDRFYLFANADGTHRPLPGAGTVMVQGPGVTSWDVSRLGVDGSVVVQTVVDPSTEQIAASKVGSNMHLTWPAAWLGVHLQSQTNTLTTGLGTNWVTIQGSDMATSYDAPLVNTNVFYRLAP